MKARSKEPHELPLKKVVSQLLRAGFWYDGAGKSAASIEDDSLVNVIRDPWEVDWGRHAIKVFDLETAMPDPEGAHEARSYRLAFVRKVVKQGKLRLEIVRVDLRAPADNSHHFNARASNIRDVDVVTLQKEADETLASHLHRVALHNSELVTTRAACRSCIEVKESA